MSDGSPPARLSAADLERFLRGDPEELGVHLSMVARDIDVAGTRTKLHCHSLAVDANGRVSLARLAEYMRRCVLDYAIMNSFARPSAPRPARSSAWDDAATAR